VKPCSYGGRLDTDLPRVGLGPHGPELKDTKLLFLYFFKIVLGKFSPLQKLWGWNMEHTLDLYPRRLLRANPSQVALLQQHILG
jgi:hypothetical protein